MVESLGLSQSALMCSKSLNSLVLSEILRTCRHLCLHISTGPGQVTQSNAHLEGAQIFFYPSLFFSRRPFKNRDRCRECHNNKRLRIRREVRGGQKSGPQSYENFAGMVRQVQKASTSFLKPGTLSIGYPVLDFIKEKNDRSSLILSVSFTESQFHHLPCSLRSC